MEMGLVSLKGLEVHGCVWCTYLANFTHSPSLTAGFLFLALNTPDASEFDGNGPDEKLKLAFTVFL